MAIELMVVSDVIPLNSKNTTAMTQKITTTLNPQLGEIKGSTSRLAICRDIR
jgi:hypothetical protein